RVDIMAASGLVDEAKVLYPHRKLNALHTVGYRELFSHFDGEWTLEFALDEIKKNTRRFAKRQITWFKRTENVQWFDYTTPPAEIINFIKSSL
ncbi:MAG: tRNA (adenosine(37)-N6)-dimethylallyltransferase MiaA, partial [Flavobacterium sp.]